MNEHDGRSAAEKSHRVQQLLRWFASKVGALVPAALKVLVGLAVLEGLSSILLFSYEIALVEQGVVERVHTQHDELLGWINVPNREIDDVYGPDTWLKINSQAFRGDRDYSPAAPEGKIRVICSGDSFAFGVEVSNDETWCHQLTVLDPRIETINMGQGGYGIDQAYLWYERDGVGFEHDAHIFTFITNDFHRMKQSHFSGYGRPTMAVEDGVLVTHNVPVPRRGYLSPLLTRLLQFGDRLRSVELFMAVLRRTPLVKLQPALPGDDEMRELAAAIFSDLAETHREKGSELLLVYFPMAHDFYIAQSDPFREFVRATAARNGWEFMDVVEHIRSLPPIQVEALYTKEWGGHFNPEGNAFAARLLYERLLAIPALRARLSPEEAPEGTSPRGPIR